MKISKTCCDISESLLVKIDGRKVYENLDFDNDQVTCRLMCGCSNTMIIIIVLHVFSTKFISFCYRIPKKFQATSRSHKSHSGCQSGLSSARYITNVRSMLPKCFF